MATLEIPTAEFLGWVFSDREDLEELGRLTVENLKKTPPEPITLDQIYASTGYIPRHLIKSCSEPLDVEWTPQSDDIVTWL